MERLGAQDLSMVLPEEFGWPQDIGALGILDGAGLPESVAVSRSRPSASGSAAGFACCPGSASCCTPPRRGLGWPLWVDAPAFTIADHVGVFPLAASAGEAQLLAACEELRQRRLDRSRPLWQMWFLPGLTEERVGLVMNVHNAIADGVAGRGLRRVPRPQRRCAGPASATMDTNAPPSGREPLRDNLHRRMHGFQGFLSGLAHPAGTVRGIRRTWPAAREMFAEGRAPRTSLNRPIGQDPTLATGRSRLDAVKGVAHTHDATVNDVLLTSNHSKPIQDSSQGELWSRPARSAA